MNIIVCIKQIQDPEIPPVKFRVDSETKVVIPPEGIPPVMDPADRQAVEAALQIKDQHEGTVTVISVGDKSSEDALRQAIAMGADEGILVSDEAFKDSDSHSIALVLAKTIEKIGEYDLILCGRQAADWDVGQVGSILAEDLGIPIVTVAKKIEVAGSGLRIEHVLSDGYEVIETPVPALITVSNEIGQPRIPTAWGGIAAARKDVPVWSAQDINVDVSQVGASANHLEILKLFIPVHERKCEIIEGESAKEAAVNLALKLSEAKIL